MIYMADIFNIISIISFILTGIFLIVSIILFFALKISLVLSYLSGRNIKQSIKKEKQNNKNTKEQLYEYNNDKEINTNYKQENLSNDDISDAKTGILNENYKFKNEQRKTERLGEQIDILLSNDDTLPLKSTHYMKPQGAGGIVFEYIDDIMLIHTEEMIV